MIGPEVEVPSFMGVGPSPVRGRVLFGTTAPVTARIFLRGQLSYLRRLGWAVQLVCGDDAGLAEFGAHEQVRTHTVPMPRDPAPITDALALLRMVALMRRLRPDVTVMGTPKMGLLGCLAAALAGIPRRVYLVHGLRFEGARQPARAVLRAAEWLACAVATEVVAVSASVRAVLIAERLCTNDKVEVLGDGSANGYDENRFRAPTDEQIAACRRELGLPVDAQVVGFVGRLTGDKGVGDLAALWRRFCREHPGTWLVAVGDNESVHPGDRAAVTWLTQAPRVVLVAARADVETVLAAVDVLVLPTRREGLSNVVLEAAAMRVPTVAYKVTGTVDAVVDGETGVLVPSGDWTALGCAVQRLLADPAGRAAMGARAQQTVATRFSAPLVWQRWSDFLERV